MVWAQGLRPRFRAKLLVVAGGNETKSLQERVRVPGTFGSRAKLLVVVGYQETKSLQERVSVPGTKSPEAGFCTNMSPYLVLQDSLQRC